MLAIYKLFCFMTSSSTGAFEHGPPSTPIQKLQYIEFQEADERWLIYSGGCCIPPGGSDASTVLSIYSNKKIKFYRLNPFAKQSTSMFNPLVPFGSRIVDFMYLPAVRCQSFQY